MPPHRGVPHPGSAAALLLRPNERKVAARIPLSRNTAQGPARPSMGRPGLRATRDLSADSRGNQAMDGKGAADQRDTSNPMSRIRWRERAPRSTGGLSGKSFETFQPSCEVRAFSPDLRQSDPHRRLHPYGRLVCVVPRDEADDALRRSGLRSVIDHFWRVDGTDTLPKSGHFSLSESS